MILRTSITRLKRFVGLKKTIKIAVISAKGGAMGIILLNLFILLTVFFVFIYASDYALFSYKRNIVGKGIDYGVCAAIQEIDVNESVGLSNEMMSQGCENIEDININEVKADSVFFSTFELNTGVKKEVICNNLLSVIVNPKQLAIDYIIKKGSFRSCGSVFNPSELEQVINAKITEYFDDNYDGYDTHVIYVNGNSNTNDFKKRPYYMVFIKNYQINGLFNKRSVTFIGFSASKIERKK